MKPLKLLLAAIVSLSAASTQAAATCDFKGLSVGDRMTQTSAMAALGITKFKTEPKRRTWDQQEKTIEKYGMVAAAEIETWGIGPFCETGVCWIPYGVDVGQNVPASVMIAFEKDLITNIEVEFGTSYWTDIAPVLSQKYGADWKVELDSEMTVTDLETKKSIRVDRINWTHRSGGFNPKTKDHCQISATNYDSVFTHHDPLGPYHAIFSIGLISKNF